MIRAAYLRQDDLEEQEAIALLGLNLKAIWLWRTPCLLVARPLLPDEEKGVFVLLLSSQLSPHTVEEGEWVPGADVSHSRQHEVRARAESSIWYPI